MEQTSPVAINLRTPSTSLFSPKAHHFTFFSIPNRKMMSFLSSSSSSSRRLLLLHLRHLSSSPPPHSTSISAEKSKLQSEHDPDKALSIYSSLSPRLSSSVSSRYALDLTVRRLAKSRRFSDIAALVESQKTLNPQTTDESFISSLILAYGRARMPHQAIQTFRDMDRHGTPRSAVSFNALLAACNLSRSFDQVPHLFSQLTHDYKIEPNKISYGILVKSLCELGRPESAISILNQMKERRIEITVVSYTTVLDSLYKKGMIEAAQRVWNEMLESGCSPDAATFNVRIMRAAIDEKPEGVLKVFDEMLVLGLKPDIISYNYLMTSYCRNGQMEDAKRVYGGLKEKGCLPNAATFRTLLHYLCRNGDFDVGLEVFRASARRGKIPDFGTMKSLVEGLVKKGKLEAAKGLIAEVKKRFPERSVNGWKQLERKLGFVVT